jgi:hypothetical protein
MYFIFYFLWDFCAHRYALSVLAASRYGLAEFELLHVLATDTQLLDELKEEAEEDLSVLEGYPYQLQLSRLITRIQPFLYEVCLIPEVTSL